MTLTDARFWKDAAALLNQDQSVFVSMVIDHTRHSPGTRGACLLLDQDGVMRGTIGGGSMELDILERGRQWLEQGDHSPVVEHLVHRKGQARQGASAPSGLICAGQQTNLHAMLQPSDLPVVQGLIERLEGDASGELVLDSQGQWSVQDAEPVGGQPLVRLDGDALGPWTFRAQVMRWRRVAIFGGGHCGLALSKLMHGLGYAVTVIDDRPQVPTFKDNTWARHKLAVEGFELAAAQVSWPAWTCAVVMTTDFPSDTRALQGLAQHGGFPYVGLMGSSAKLKAISKALAARGVALGAIKGLHAPVGLPIESSTPEEIAVSVSAQILQLRPSLFPVLGPSSF